jgi:hypothetical protein
MPLAGEISSYLRRAGIATLFLMEAHEAEECVYARAGFKTRSRGETHLEAGLEPDFQWFLVAEGRLELPTYGL